MFFILMMIECPPSSLSSTSKPDFQALLQQQFPILAWTSGSKTRANPILHWISSCGSNVRACGSLSTWSLLEASPGKSHSWSNNKQRTVILVPCLNYLIFVVSSTSQGSSNGGFNFFLFTRCLTESIRPSLSFIQFLHNMKSNLWVSFKN